MNKLNVLSYVMRTGKSKECRGQCGSVVHKSCPCSSHILCQYVFGCNEQSSALHSLLHMNVISDTKLGFTSACNGQYQAELCLVQPNAHWHETHILKYSCLALFTFKIDQKNIQNTSCPWHEIRHSPSPSLSCFFPYALPLFPSIHPSTVCSLWVGKHSCSQSLENLGERDYSRQPV